MDSGDDGPHALGLLHTFLKLSITNEPSRGTFFALLRPFVGCNLFWLESSSRSPCGKIAPPLQGRTKLASERRSSSSLGSSFAPSAPSTLAPPPSHSPPPLLPHIQKQFLFSNGPLRSLRPFRVPRHFSLQCCIVIVDICSRCVL